ncbi:PREDICTED: uncharacterized protein LOC109337736 [Lupinus angustifolius]|uniref:uncharacterized protein LOC109337734 n=1 Tax=Lupinus angustifolius TaxID=3871 RepID=UPI00092FC562|nr:PREDICTED: uncharacterized protein LOC109337734 [Lupinus angustifolius]XP_019430320.1 PREDICTED: uncharacterized protein LOC109337736 [Lupinus angustifolius]
MVYLILQQTHLTKDWLGSFYCGVTLKGKIIFEENNTIISHVHCIEIYALCAISLYARVGYFPFYGSMRQKTLAKGKLRTTRQQSSIKCSTGKYDDVMTALKLSNYPCALEYLDVPTNKTIETLAGVPAPELALLLYLQCAEAANGSDLEPVAYEFFTQA